MGLVFSRDKDSYSFCEENSKTYRGFVVSHFIQHSGLFYPLTNETKWSLYLKLAVQNQDQFLI